MTEYACSVVVPTYNAAEALPSQLAALASQDFTEPIEVVISDNGVNSTSSAEIARSWSDRLTITVVDSSRRTGRPRWRGTSASLRPPAT